VKSTTIYVQPPDGSELFTWRFEPVRVTTTPVFAFGTPLEGTKLARQMPRRADVSRQRIRLEYLVASAGTNGVRDRRRDGSQLAPKGAPVR